jgi:V8-like Glu-specific endopeptidase
MFKATSSLMKITSFLILHLIISFTLTPAQTTEIPMHQQSYNFHSGYYNGSAEGTELVQTKLIGEAGIPWLNVHFSNYNLSSSSYIIITSLKDGLWQKHTQKTLEQWDGWSAFFNGDAVEVELYVATEDQDVYFEVDQLTIGEWSGGIESQCGPTDDRIASNDPRTGRLLSIGCTAWIIPNGKFVTAGHCVSGSGANIVQFNVPLSTSGGTIQHPGPEDQYSVISSSREFQDAGVGNDWGVFEVNPNTNTGLMPIVAQGAFFMLVQNFGPDSIRITGYGVDNNTPIYNQVQQTHIGPNVGSSGTTMRYRTDTEGGNSGSPVIDEATNTAVGVHTHGGCNTAGTGNNNGTSFFHTTFWNAVEQGAGGNPDTIAPTTITDLAVSDTTSNTLTLTWTTPFDTSFGGIVGYEIRRALTPINDLTAFQNATPVPFTGTPGDPGDPEMLEVSGLDFNTTYYFSIRSNDFWNNWSDISNSPDGQTFGAPTASATPDSLHMSLVSGTTSNGTLTLSNISSGNSTLDYSISFENNSFPEGSLKLIQTPVNNDSRTIDERKENPSVNYGQSIDGLGGPDAFGYEWIDSDEPNGPAYVWEDISTTGTEVTNWTASSTFDPEDEGYAGPFPLGFNFKFYGNTKTEVYVGSNGLVLFSPISGNFYTNASIPNAENPNEFIAAFWDDLDGSSQGTVYYKQDGGRFIVQFTNWQKYSGTGSLTFQVVLHSSGKILIYYNNMNATLTSATVGIENADASIGLQVAYNASYIHNDLALQFSAEPDWLGASPLSGTLYNGNSVDIDLEFRSEDFPEGNYSMDLVISSNDPANQTITVPVTMTIVPVPVELTSLSAETEKNSVTLKWATASEINNQGFEVQRKEVKNQNNWEAVGFIEGRGNTTERQSYSFYEKDLKVGNYFYRLKQIDFDGSYEYSDEIEVSVDVPSVFSLMQNYPNPFNPMTKIEYTLPENAEVRLDVYNSLGELVTTLLNKQMEAGYQVMNFDASSLPSGTYIYRITAKGKTGNFVDSKKMLLVK